MILTDRHHADLLYSIQRLFEDRLGIEVFIPIGFEWWDEGIWQFGACFGDDRLAQQYLQISDGVFHDQGDGLWTTVDSSQPHRTIRCLTLEGFRARRGLFRFVMPTVQENLPGYRRLADEAGVRLLYHVCNTGQFIDWDLDPFIISTSEAAIPEGRGIVIHQEIDSFPHGAFGFTEPVTSKVVRNGVNAFNRIPGYEDFLAAEAALAPESWEFTIHGHEGRDGDINPAWALGFAWKSAGWGWHTKPVGDGYGHVIHSWAAVGRPLVGRAEFYRGKMAEPFWQDGVTAIDLGAHGLDDTIRLLREIGNDPDRHAEMCRAIRGAFDDLVDYGVEEDIVRRALGLPAA